MSALNIPVDDATLDQAVSALKSNPALLDNLAQDAQKTLKSLGLKVDDETASTIQAQAQSPIRSNTYQAAIIHIDT